ncbi:MAG: beta-aspartyl-peptidase [Burkholderiales bacterium]|nr:beta-aspartyl-peptidase [Burkholderiales bacterium]
MPTGYLLRKADLFCPEHLGKRDILVIGEKILLVDEIIDVKVPGLEVIDLAGLTVTPGLFDQHIHVLGGGGEGGPVTRAPELNFSELVQAGITGFVGVCGTDSETRPIEALLAKVRALTKEGASGWMWTSNYRYPPTTITGDVRKELLTIPECLGVKIAMGDHRGSFPTTHEVLRVLSDCRVGGMICGHDAYLHVHLGDIPVAFPAFLKCVDMGMPIKHIRPTHVARQKEVFAQAIDFAKAGGWIDITTSGGNYMGEAADAYVMALKEGAPANRITFSSDGHGSMPRWRDGEMVGMTICKVSDNLEQLQKLAGMIGLEKALLPLTRTVTEALCLNTKGTVEAGKDADILVMDKNLKPVHLFMRGKQVMKDSEVIVKGTFEE